MVFECGRKIRKVPSLKLSVSSIVSMTTIMWTSWVENPVLFKTTALNAMEIEVPKEKWKGGEGHLSTWRVETYRLNAATESYYRQRMCAPLFAPMAGGGVIILVTSPTKVFSYQIRCTRNQTTRIKRNMNRRLRSFLWKLQLLCSNFA